MVHKRRGWYVFKTLNGHVKSANRQTGNPKNGQHFPESLYLMVHKRRGW